MTAASLAARTLFSGGATAQTLSETASADVQFSVMIWTLKKMGTFEENLERVAQAGYHHIELGRRVQQPGPKRITAHSGAAWRS